MDMKKLGRGLDSLIEETRIGAGGAVSEIETRAVRPNPFQPREVIRPEELEELASSIRTHGLLQPILVRPVEGGYEVVAGERRWRAAQAAGLERIPATVRDVDDGQMLELALVENLQREDLNPIEKARAYRRYLDSLGLTHEAAAQRLGKDRTSITNQVRLLDLSPEIQEMVSRGTLSMGHARALLGLTAPEARLALARRIEKDGLSVRDTERLVRETSEPAPPTSPPPRPLKSAWFEDLERRLRERFATKARIDGGKEKGRITIEYYSMDDLSRLLESLLGEPL
jgi:ParB family chromosome partitioning protein